MKPEEKLIAACLKRDRAACKKLYEIHVGKLLAVAMRYARDKASAEDIVQDGFIKIFRDLHQYQPIAPLYSWMRTVLVRTALEHIRKHRKAEEQTEGITSSQTAIGINEDVSAELHRKDLMLLIQALPEKLRIVFNLYAIEGYTHAEIGHLLDISISNSKVRLNRARKELQNQLEQLAQEDKLWNSTR